MHEVLVNRLGGLSLPRKSVVRLTDRPDMTLDVYRGRKTTKQQHTVYSVYLPELVYRNDYQIQETFRAGRISQFQNGQGPLTPTLTPVYSDRASSVATGYVVILNAVD